MQAHLLRMFSNRKAQVLYADEAHHGYFVITDKVTLILIPNRNFQDSVAIKFTGKEQQEVFLEMFTRLSALSDPVKSEERLKSLYDELKSVGH